MVQRGNGQEMSEGMSHSDAIAGLESAGSDNGASFTPPATSAPAPPVQVPNNVPPPPVGNQQSQSGGHPAWQPILSKIPEGFHPIVRPAFEEWDKGVQSKLEQVHSQYAPYKPFLERGVEAEKLEQAYQLYELLNNDPRQIYDGLAQHFGFADEQGQEDGEEYDLGDDREGQQPTREIQELRHQQEQIAAHLQQQQQQQMTQEAETWVDTNLQTATQTLQQAGLPADKYAMRYILTTALGISEAGGNRDTAFQEATNEYVSMVNEIRSQPRVADTAPPVLPTSGGTPSNYVNPADMTDKERRNLGVNWLTQALGGG